MASVTSGKSFFRLTGSTLSTGNYVSVVYEFSTVISGGNFDGDRAARATMKTLYDLLGALPSDDAEDLRTAFRKAVKGTHPDIHPDDPDAALKFREIVRANEILIDDEQRAAYDHLLQLAHQEASKQAIAVRVHKAASVVLALATVSVVTVGGYLVFAQMPAASLTPAKLIDAAIHASAVAASAGPAASPDAIVENISLAKSARAEIFGEPAAPGIVMPEPNAEIVPVVNASQTPDPRFLRAQGETAYRSGDLYGALAALDHAIDLDPKYLHAYIDRGIVLYRLQKFDRAYADISRAKRIEKSTHPKPALAAKRSLNPAGTAPSMTPVWQRRASERHPLEFSSAGP
jgi:tetratricopeptide (TPR) repeat protein